MIIVKSSEYELIGWDRDENLWHFERLSSKVGDTIREKLLVGQAKYVDKSTTHCYHLNSDGRMVLKGK